MPVYGVSTSLDPVVREGLRNCAGTLCVRRNGLSHKVRRLTVLTDFGPSHSLGVFNNSVDTIERAFAERYFMCKEGNVFRPALVVSPSQFRTTRFVQFRDAVLDSMPSLPVLSLDEVVKSYHGPKRRVYEAAVRSFVEEDLSEKDARLTAFVKFEKQDLDKAPRIINPRNPRYNVKLGKYLKHAEHHFFRAINKAFGKRTQATVIKGYNADVSAKILREKWDCFVNPVAIGLDASKFDMHVSVAALKYEHSFYRRLYPRSKLLGRLLRWQLNNAGCAYALDGSVKFKMQGTRCSGDLNTSLGNCILMCAMVWVYAKTCGVDLELANNGDDCVVIMEAEHAAKFRAGIPTFFRRCGFAMTVEDTVDEFEQIEFCQTRPVQLSTGWRMVRNLKACLIKDVMCLIPIPNNTVYKRWLWAVGECGLSLCTGVPVLEAFYRFFMRHGLVSTKEFQEEVFRNRSQLQLARGVAAASIDARARVSFYVAFGVTPDLQLAMERRLDKLVIGEVSATPLDRDAWRSDPGVNVLTEVDWLEQSDEK